MHVFFKCSKWTRDYLITRSVIVVYCMISLLFLEEKVSTVKKGLDLFLILIFAFVCRAGRL